MAMVQCENRHFYDNRRHTYCPYCPIPGLRGPVRRPPLSSDLPGILPHVSQLHSSDKGKFLQRVLARISPGRERELPHPVNPVPRVFISSTFRDLELFRQAAFEAIQALGAVGENMIYWSADDREPSELSKSKVERSDVLVLILAHRYGTIPPGSSYSVTELEYRAAREANVPVLAFILDSKTPWPPDHIDWSQKDRLDAFKEVVRGDVTAKTFSSTEDLSRLITQALANFQDKNREVLIKAGLLKMRALPVSLPAKIRTEPSVLVPLGLSEDGLPFILNIKRSRSLQPHLDLLFKTIGRDHSDATSGLYSNIKQLLEEEAIQYWSSERIFDVQMHNDTKDSLYVTHFDLSHMRTLLFRLLAAKTGPGKAQATQAAGITHRTESEFPIVSSGGENRHLAISIRDGRVYSVGLRGDKWVEWRPFLWESIESHFPDAEYLVAGTGDSFRASEYPALLTERSLRCVDEDGRIHLTINVRVPRRSVARVIVEIARELQVLHGQGLVHGDLKPQNVLLTPGQIELIDGFNVRDGRRAPGWTPYWAAPEQVTGGAISYSADIYPLGVMVAHLLGAELVGEVRYHVAPNWLRGTSRHEVLHDPAPFIDESRQAISGQDMLSWITFVMECLKFDQTRRPSCALEFAERLEGLIEARSPLGHIEVLSSSYQLVAATLPDGTDSVARMLSDDPPGNDDDDDDER
jgi:hypothetical protein